MNSGFGSAPSAIGARAADTLQSAVEGGQEVGGRAEALGMPGRYDHEAASAGPSAAQLAAVCAATGLPPPTVTAMLAAGPSPPRPLILAWAPQRACGGQLVNRRPRPPDVILTPLGQQLCHQVREHLGLRR